MESKHRIYTKMANQKTVHVHAESLSPFRTMQLHIDDILSLHLFTYMNSRRMVSYFSSVMATQRHTDIEILNPGHTKRSAACTTFLNVGGHQKAIVGLDEQQIHEFYRHMIITLFSFPRKHCLQGITFLNVSRLDLQFYFSYPTGSPIPTKVGLWNSLAYQAICPPHWSWTGCQDTLNGSTYWAKESGLV